VASGPIVDRRRALVATLSSVLRASPVSSVIDPDGFAHILSADRGRLLRGDELDLEALYESWVEHERPDHLYAVVLTMEVAARALGFHATPPAAALRLSKMAREAQVRALLAGAPPAPRPPDPAQWVQASRVPLPVAFDPVAALTAAGAAPSEVEIPVAHRHALAHALAWSLVDSDAGARLSGFQVVHLVEAHFTSQCDGHRFLVRPLVLPLLAAAGVSAGEAWAPLERFRRYLARFGLETDAPGVEASASVRARAEVAIGRQVDLADLYPMAVAKGAGTVAVEASAPAEGELPPEIAAELEAWNEAMDLERALSTTRPEGGPPASLPLGRFRWVRTVALAALLGATVVVAWLAQPVHGLDTERYAASVPLRDARRVDGSFVAVLDEPGWARLDRETRTTALKTLESTLREDGLMRGVRILDETRRLVIFDVKGERLAASEELMQRGLSRH
jgi:hypothetical protein